MKYLAVFCGSKLGTSAILVNEAKKLGKIIAQSGWGLVYGGGRVGLMGIVADAVLEEGGQVIGVIPDFMMGKELAHENLTELFVVKSMHERKMVMAEKADAFVALPGGFGTLDEWNEIVTWRQLGLHNKPIGLLNIEGFFDFFIQFLNHSVSSGFVDRSDVSGIHIAKGPAEIFKLLSAKN